MRMLRFATWATLGLLLLVGTARADDFTYVPITSVANNNIQTGLISTFPTGIITADNVLATPFDIPSTGSNFYDGFSGAGSSIVLDVSVADPTNVFTLMNAYDPAATELATVEFVGTGGTSITFELVGGSDIRDFYQGMFVNSLSNSTAGVAALNAYTCTQPTNCAGAGGSGSVTDGLNGTYVVDEQDFDLGSTFEGQTLTEIIITDTYGGSTPILLGVTVESGSSANAPEPSSLGMLSLGVVALFGFALVGRFTKSKESLV